MTVIFFLHSKFGYIRKDTVSHLRRRVINTRPLRSKVNASIHIGRGPGRENDQFNS